MFMETLESALEILLAHAAPVTETETLPLPDALGRVLAEDVTSPIAVPPFDRSPLDGYALRAADIADASKEAPAVVRVIGESDAGCGTFFHPAAGEAVRVMTGAMVPAECDCVIRQEDTDLGMETVRVYAPVKAGMNVCFKGEDTAAGAVLAKKGDRVTAAHIGVMSGCGITEAKAYRRVRAALVCTGDELTMPGQELTPGKIYDSNRAVLSARMAELGVELLSPAEALDDAKAVAQLLKQAADRADVLLTTGGVSVGRKDIMHEALPLSGAEKLFWKIAMKPGSPLLCGMLNGKPLICLSGNPYAALACFELFAVPVLKKTAGLTRTVQLRVKTVLRGAFAKESRGRRIIRGYFNGREAVVTGSDQSSGSLMTMIGANCLLDIPAGTPPLRDGDEVEAVLL